MEKEVGRWLDPREKGDLLHEVFFRFMVELKEKKERPVLKKHLKRLETIAIEEVEKWKEKVPPGSEVAFNQELEEINQSLRIFLSDEEERCRKGEPCFFEVSLE